MKKILLCLFVVFHVPCFASQNSECENFIKSENFKVLPQDPITKSPDADDEEIPDAEPRLTPRQPEPISIPECYEEESSNNTPTQKMPNTPKHTRRKPPIIRNQYTDQQMDNVTTQKSTTPNISPLNQAPNESTGHINTFCFNGAQIRSQSNSFVVIPNSQFSTYPTFGGPIMTSGSTVIPISNASIYQTFGGQIMTSGSTVIPIDDTTYKYTTIQPTISDMSQASRTVTNLNTLIAPTVTELNRNNGLKVKKSCNELTVDISNANNIRNHKTQLARNIAEQYLIGDEEQEQKCIEHLGDWCKLLAMDVIKQRLSEIKTTAKQRRRSSNTRSSTQIAQRASTGELSDACIEKLNSPSIKARKATDNSTDSDPDQNNWLNIARKESIDFLHNYLSCVNYEQATRNLLSIDGGGCRGLVPAKMLDYIAQRAQIGSYTAPNEIKVYIQDVFDVFAGTSIGGIIAIGLLLRDSHGKYLYEPRDLLEILKKNGGVIFSRNAAQRIWSRFRGIFRAKYSNRKLKLLVRAMIYGADDIHPKETFLKSGLKVDLSTGGTIFDRKNVIKSLIDVRNMGKRLIVPTYDIVNNRAVIFDSEIAGRNDTRNFGNVYLLDLCMATSAAPTTLPSYPFTTYNPQTEFNGIDGGMFSNDPGPCAISREIGDSQVKQRTRIISLSTGSASTQTENNSVKDRGLISWGLHGIVSIFMRSSMQLSEDFVEHCANESIRLNVPLKSASSSMDNASKENIQRLLSDTDNYLAASESSLEKIDKIVKQKVEKIRRHRAKRTKRTKSMTAHQSIKSPLHNQVIESIIYEEATSEESSNCSSVYTTYDEPTTKNNNQPSLAEI